LLGFQNQFCPLVFVTSTVAILEWACSIDVHKKI
jgi:hypothetical protein